MNDYDKKWRKALIEVMDAQGGRLFSDAQLGVTVLIVPCAGEHSKFADVAVAQCDFKDDEFKRKRGELIALERWANNESLSVGFDYRTFEEIYVATVKLLVG